MKAEELYKKEFGDLEVVKKDDVIRLIQHFAKVLSTERQQLKNCNLQNVSVSVAVEEILRPKYMNDVYTWKQIQDAINKATER